MNSGKRKLYKCVLFMNILSSCILFTLVSTQVISSGESENSTSNNTIKAVLSNQTSDEENIIDKESNAKSDLIENELDYFEEKSTAQPIGVQEFIFAEGLSQNSAVVNGGLAETGQPVLVTLVDTAAAELTTTAAEQLDLDKGSNNYTDPDPDYDSAPVTLELPQELENSTAEVLEAKVVIESQDNLKTHYVVRTISKEKEDERATEKLKDGTNVINGTGDSVVSVKSDNATSDGDSAKRPDAAAASEAQEEIPSFAEWAQKQMEEAEKNKENGVNHSSQSSLGTISSGVNLKVRSKNYASPDCGAKIVAANPEAGSSSFILTPSRDEYMLNTCNSRIWFIVELCEAIQAKKVDMANFELFSSTPKNFSVSVSDRFPSREWASVGQFIAKDERDIQMFNLHPHLFGKFIKVELHSYYGSEHYCPISLFRVYGTSEFEVFETENSPNSQSNQAADDDEDDILEDAADKENIELSRNLFGSARDAVMSIMKKAAQVLVKGSDSKNSSDNVQTSPPDIKKCKTPSHIVVCDNCSNSMFTQVYDLMSCKSDVLNGLIESPLVHDALCNTDMCQQYGLDFKSKRTSSFKTEIASYVSALLMPSYVAALCNMLAIIEKKVVLNTSSETDLNVTTNLTIDKKVQKAVESGTLNEILQNSFSACVDTADHPSCKGKPTDDFKPDIVPSITSSMPSDIEGGSINDIKPTKTLQRDSDPLEPSIVTVGASSDKTINSQQNDKIYNDGQTIEASMINNFEQKATETLTKDESVKMQIDESVKEISVKSEDSQDIDSVVVPQDLNNEADSINLEEGVDEGNIKLSTQDQISLDNLLSELEKANNDHATPSPQNNALPTLSHQGQKESVFLRLSNRIKALERNMSLSGQYLEELSRRYKKQMEEMQKTFEKTLITMNEESKKAEEREKKSSEEMLFLQQQMAQMSSAVSALLTDRDSWLGSATLLKVMFFQIFLTVFVVYIFRRLNSPRNEVSERNLSNVKTNSQQDEPKIRRRSTEEMPTSRLGEDRQARRRRPSEEALNIARTVSEMHESALVKNDKKRRKRKSPIFRRSYSIAAPTEAQLASTQNAQSSTTPVVELWSRPDINGKMETPIALDEAEFIIPEIEQVDFNRMGEMKLPIINGITPKKEFPKTNGSIFGKKNTDIDKSGKVRRLSSPAFFRAALNRQSSKSATSDPSVKGVSPIVETAPQYATREVRSEEREVRAGTESPQLSTWSSIGDVSEASSSTQADSETGKKKKSKGRSLKNIFKKVF